MIKFVVIFLFMCSSAIGQMGRFSVSTSITGAGGAPAPTQDALARYDFESADPDGDEEGDYDLTLVGGAASYASYHVTGSACLTLNGAGRYASVDYTDLGNEFSISFWVYKQTLVNYPRIWDAYDGAGSDGIFCDIDASSDRIRVKTANGSDTDYALSTTSLGLPLSTWFHVVVVIDRTAGTALIYYNNSDVTSDGTIRTDFSTTETFIVGSDDYNFYGYIDQVQVYKWKLTSTQVSDLYNNPANEQTQ